MPGTIHPIAIEAAGRHMRHCMATVQLDLKRGLNHLGTAVSTIPLLGFLGTHLEMMASYRGCPCPAAETFITSLAEALFPAALGLLLAIPALWCHRYLTGRVDTAAVEMQAESLGLLNLLSRLDGTPV